MDLVLGIDCSTTACKAIAWDASGSPVAEGRAPLELLAPQPGWGEQVADDWWRVTQAAVRQVVDAVGANRIAALCITHQRETFVPVNARGEPLRNAILWLDERSRPQLAELDRRFGHDRIHRLTGRPPSLTQSLPKLMWVVEHEPEIAAAADKFLDVHAFLVHRLTGEWVTSLACADPMGIIDMKRGQWAKELIEGIGLRGDQFVSLAPQGSVLGKVNEAAAQSTGLLAGTPVVAGAGDGQAACLGAGVVGPGRAYVNLGTAIAGGCATSRYVTDLAYRTDIGAIPGTFVLESVLRGGTATVTWFMEHFADPRQGRDAYGYYEAEAAKLPPGAGGLTLVPYWNNVMNPYWDPAASGIVVGWNTSHRRHHLYRAILEGIALEHRLAIEGIVASCREPVSEHVILGGGSRSDLWCQIMADVLGAPVSRARSADATNLGAGILAAAAVGWYPSIAEAAQAMTATTKTFVPEDDARQWYDRLYREVYRPLFPAIRPYIDRLTEITDEIMCAATTLSRA